MTMRAYRTCEHHFVGRCAPKLLVKGWNFERFRIWGSIAGFLTPVIEGIPVPAPRDAALAGLCGPVAAGWVRAGFTGRTVLAATEKRTRQEAVRAGSAQPSSHLEALPTRD